MTVMYTGMMASDETVSASNPKSVSGAASRALNRKK